MLNTKLYKGCLPYALPVVITEVDLRRKLGDKVGLLEGSDGNVITEEFLMADNLNEYFSSVFTREAISILPVLETKFEWRVSDYLRQLILTPKMVAMNIRDMKDNRSPGGDSSQITIENSITNQHTASDNVQCVIR